MKKADLIRENAELRTTIDRVVRNESNHYDRYWTPVETVTDDWLDATEAKMRGALTDAFCDDAAAVMLTLIAEIRRLRNDVAVSTDARQRAIDSVAVVA